MSNRPIDPEISYWLSPQAIRHQANRIYSLACSGKTHFQIGATDSTETESLDSAVSFVQDVILKKYPDLNIPMHSRWGHFQVGEVNRLRELKKRLENFSASDRCRAHLDLVLVSVLLDAGAGPDWKYREAETELLLSRSEGLAVASLRMFMDGAFSSDPNLPLQVDSHRLRHLTLRALQEGFQVTDVNPLNGLQGRLDLLHRLGEALESDGRFFLPAGGVSRPGHLLDHLLRTHKDRDVPAAELLQEILFGLGPIWPGRSQLNGVSLGDTWDYPGLGWVPFHKLSQWLTYSLIEPLEDAGLKVSQIDELTGLAEYRNGGLILDSGLIRLRDPRLANEVHRVDSPLVIEWRALTIVFLDRIAEGIRFRLKKTAKEMPLIRVLEGGTWWAGRELAARLRPQAAPPLRIESDGTVF